MEIEATDASKGSNSPLLARLRDTLAHPPHMQSAPESASALDSTLRAPVVVQSQPDRVRPNVGKSVRFKGDINGDGDVDIDGTLEGSVSVPANTVTVRSSGFVQGCITARNVIVGGKVNGDITARERIELKASARVDGEVEARRIVVSDGARITGRVEMSEADLCADTIAEGQEGYAERKPNGQDFG